MNIFQSESDIFGNYGPESLQNLLCEFLSQAQSVSTRLGKEAHLLDKYLSYLLEAANLRLAYNAASDGFEYGSRLRLLCAGILRGEVQEKDSFFCQAKSYIETHPLPFLEQPTQLAVYWIALSEPFLESACLEYYQELSVESSMFLDIHDLNELYKEICAILSGSEDMDQLNLQFRKRFLIAPAMAVFQQGMADHLIYSLTLRDNETSKQVFQLLLESPQLIMKDK